jgi:hypothetical protein
VALRPIDLQVMLTQMHEVGKIDSARINKKRTEDISKDKKNLKKSREATETIGDLDRVEVSGDQLPAVKNETNKQKHGKRKSENEDKAKHPSAGKFKGNFLDITE